MRFYYTIISEKKWLVYNIYAGGYYFSRVITNSHPGKMLNSILVLIDKKAATLILLKAAAL